MASTTSLTETTTATVGKSSGPTFPSNESRISRAGLRGLLWRSPFTGRRLQRVGRPLGWLARQEVFHRKPDVFRNLAQQRQRNVAPLMKGHGRTAAVRVPKLSVRTPWPDFGKPSFPRSATTSRGVRTGSFATAYATSTVCVPTNTLSSRGSPSSSSISTTS